MYARIGLSVSNPGTYYTLRHPCVLTFLLVLIQHPYHASIRKDPPRLASRVDDGLTLQVHIDDTLFVSIYINTIWYRGV